MKTDSAIALQIAERLEPMSDQGIKLILVGGCSRSGKSTLSQNLATEIHNRKHSATVLSMDSWIIGIDGRPEKSSVNERYDMLQIIRDISAILSGEPVTIPTYDAKSRKRLLSRREPVHIASGYLILEGVLALSRDELRQSALLSIYVEIEDSLRKQRFESFYSETKGLSPQEVEEIFCEREAEEVPTVKMTRQYADVICKSGELRFSHQNP